MTVGEWDDDNVRRWRGLIIPGGDITGEAVHIWHGRVTHIAFNYGVTCCGKFWTRRRARSQKVCADCVRVLNAYREEEAS